MPIRPDAIRRPSNPSPREYVPAHSMRYKVRDGDTWQSVAKSVSERLHTPVDAGFLIRFNFRGVSTRGDFAPEVNWYLKEYVGCTRLSGDSRSFLFSSGASPGLIYLPTVASDLGAVEAPVIVNIRERRESIMANTPAIFVVADASDVKAEPDPVYSIHAYEEVTKNEEHLEKMALRYGLDPDFVKAVAWLETTHGYYDRINPFNQSIRPMNVHLLWTELGVTKGTLERADVNIATGVHILAAIWERTENPTIEKVATLYNALGATTVSVYGKTVAEYARAKPWKRQQRQTAPSPVQRSILRSL